MQYRRLIEQLLELEGSGQNSVVYLSCYIPSEFEHKKDLARYIKSRLVQEFRRNEKLKSFSSHRQAIAARIVDSFKSIKDFKRGVAVFAKLDPVELEDRKGFMLFVYPLAHKPKEEISAGEAFDIDQLLWFENFNTFAVLLEEKDAKVFFIRDRKITLVKEFENDFLDAELREGMTKISGGVDQLFGVISDRESFEAEQIKHFLKQVYEWLLQSREKFDVRYIVFYMSPKFYELRKDLEEELKGGKRFQIIFIDKILKEESEILETTWREVKKRVSRTKKDLLRKTKNNEYNLYVEGWEGVIRASNENRIDKLFAESSADESGFIDNNGLLHLQKTEGSRSTGNLAPWVIKKVLGTGGEVVVFKEQKIGSVPIAARLRY